MTEIEAQKFIARHTPRLHRCETTQAKIQRIRSQFWVYFSLGTTLLFLSLNHISRPATIDIILNVAGLALGTFLIGFAFWMKRRLQEACRLVSKSQIANLKS